MKRGHHDIAVKAFEVNVPAPKAPKPTEANLTREECLDVPAPKALKPTEAIASQDDTVAQVFHVYRKA